MCGFVGGILTHEPSESDVREFIRARETLAHRGPDAAGLTVIPETRTVLAFRRLAIIDIASGDQPMQLDNGACIAFNGEIYNHENIRPRLLRDGVTLRTRSDTEVLLHMLVRHGVAGLDPLKGMFAFAFVSPQTGQLLLARDRLGVKQLYYTQNGRGFFFASEPKALLALRWVQAELATERLPSYFVFRSVPAPHTLFRGISKIPAGCALSFDVKTMHARVDPYWQIPSGDARRRSTPSLRASVDQLEERLLESVRLRLVSDVPVGAFLSGGLDSSLIVAAMHRLGCKDIQSFTATFPGTPDDESRYALRVSERFGTTHHERHALAADFLDALPRWVRLNDDLVADASSLPLMLVSDAARRAGCRVMLSGEGADELFGGYGSYHKFIALHALSRAVPSIQTRDMLVRCAAALRLVGAENVPRVREYFVRGGEYAGTAAVFTLSDIGRLLEPSLCADAFDLAKPKGHSLGAISQFELRGRIPDDLLVRTDRATMGASIEARVPFLDHDLVETVLRFSPRARSLPGLSKITPRLLARRWRVPLRTIVHRKMGFQLPLGAWFRRPLRSLWHDVLKQRAVPGIRYAAVERLYDAHIRGDGHHEEILWRVIALESWYRQWIADDHLQSLGGREEAAYGLEVGS